MKLNCTVSFSKINKQFVTGLFRMIVAWGGSRSGKTYAILQILLVYLMTNNNKKVTVWRNTRVTCRDTVMDDFQQILLSDEGLNKRFKLNKSKATFTCIKTGSRIIFEGADQIGKVLGSRQDISYFNEVTEFNEGVYLQITQRTAEHIFADYNPSKSFWLEKFKKREDTVFIHSTYRDNYMCPPEIVKQLNGYRPIDTDLIGSDYTTMLRSISDKQNATTQLQKIQSKLNLTDLQTKNLYIGWLNEYEGTAKKYEFDVYCEGTKSEKPDKIYHRWKTIHLNDYLSLPYTEYNGLDFGTAKPTAMVGVKWDGDITFYIRKKIYTPAGSEGGIIRLLKSAKKAGLINKDEDLIVADPAKQSYITKVQNAGYQCVKAKKGNGSVESGIETLQSFNIVYVYDYDLEEEYNDYSFHIDRYGEATDVPIKKGDHLMDALRYIITYLVGWLDIKLK